MALMISRLIVGASSFGWWVPMGSVAAVYASLLAGHLAVALGFMRRRSRQRLIPADAADALHMVAGSLRRSDLGLRRAYGGGPRGAGRASRPAGRPCPLPGVDIDRETGGESRKGLERLAEVLEASAPPRWFARAGGSRPRYASGAAGSSASGTCSPDWLACFVCRCHAACWAWASRSSSPAWCCCLASDRF